MGISSLGVGSNVLTQDVVDQLRAADEAQFIAPVDSRIKAEKSKSAALEVVDALMDNVYGSLKSLTEYGVFESRAATTSDEDVATVTANDSSDIQDFSIEIDHLATKEIEQSNTFSARDAKIATGSGELEIAVGEEKFIIDYTDEMTLDDLKNLINKQAGSSIDATIVQMADDDFRLMLSADSTGTGQEISITDLGNDAGDKTLDTALTDDMTNVQTAVDASFKFNGLEITRKTNSVDDLLSGVTITLQKAGTTNISVQQNREHIESKITNFIDKYNSALYQVSEDTKSSQNVEERGAFSSDSTIKGMKRDMQNILNTVGSGVGMMQDYGIEIGEDGRLSLDSSTLNEKLNENPTNTQAFLTGGDFLNADGVTKEIKGIFAEMEDEFAKYSKRGAILDDYKTSIQDRMDSLSEQRDKAMERLNSRYETLTKQWGAYDLMISKLNASSAAFLQMANSFSDAQNNQN